MGQLVRIKFWHQETMESGRWCLTAPMSEESAKRIIDNNWYESPVIVPLENKQDVNQGPDR